jgi:hypothetical protein
MMISAHVIIAIVMNGKMIYIGSMTIHIVSTATTPMFIHVMIVIGYAGRTMTMTAKVAGEIRVISYTNTATSHDQSSLVRIHAHDFTLV